LSSNPNPYNLSNCFFLHVNDQGGEELYCRGRGRERKEIDIRIKPNKAVSWVNVGNATLEDRRRKRAKVVED